MDIEHMSSVMAMGIQNALGPLKERLAALEANQKHLLAQNDVLTKELAQTRERVAVTEVRPLMPGAPGAPGAPGQDGVGYDDLVTEKEGDRTIVVRAARGERVKEVGRAHFPFMIYRGIWVADKDYELGDTCTWSGSLWHADKSTRSKPGERSSDWTLACKRGQDGRDLRPDMPKPALPVVQVGKPKPDTIFTNAPVVS